MGNRQTFLTKVEEQPIGSKGDKYWKWAGSGKLDWCAIFVCYCASQAGILGKLIPNTWGAGDVPRLGVPKGWGSWYEANDPKFTPQAGDIILYNPWEEGIGYVSPPYAGHDKYYSSHIGIVVTDMKSDGTFETVEGNTGTYDCTTSKVGRFTRNKHKASNYNINGFYRPNWGDESGYIPVSSRKWICKDESLNAKEQQNNAILVAQKLLSIVEKDESGKEIRPWSLQAVAAILGNMEYESTINPGRWEVGKPKKGPYTGYGLCQWTPYTQLLPDKSTTDNKDWVHHEKWENNGDLQCDLLEYQRKHGGVSVAGGWYNAWGVYQSGETYIPFEASGIFSFKQFASNTVRSAYDLARFFLFHYERAYDVSADAQKQRGKAANKWYQYLTRSDEIYASGGSNQCNILQKDAKTVKLTGSINCDGNTSIKLYYRWNNEVDLDKKLYNECLNIHTIISNEDIKKLTSIYGEILANRFLAVRYELTSPKNDIQYWLKTERPKVELVNAIAETNIPVAQDEIEYFPKDFDFEITKVRTATKICVLLETINRTLDENDKDIYTTSQSVFSKELTPSYPCMWITKGEEIVSTIPYIKGDDGNLYMAVPVIKYNGALYKLYDTDAEKL